MSLAPQRVDDKGDELLKTYCPYCRAPLNAATATEENYPRPKPGDLSLCSTCGGFLCFDDLMLPTKLQQEQFSALDVNLQAELSYLQDFIRTKNPQ